MRKRTYNGKVDLWLLQDFNAAAIAISDHCGYLHPGDIPHHIYNGNKHYDPVNLISIWEDDHGVAAWLLADPSHKSFDAQVRPDLRGNDLEREVLEYAEDRVVELMRRHDIAGDCIYADAFRGDAARIQTLTVLGWEPDNELPYVLNRTEINADPGAGASQRFHFPVGPPILKMLPPWLKCIMPPSGRSGLLRCIEKPWSHRATNPNESW